MSFRLSEPTLIEGSYEWRVFLLGASIIFLLSLGWRYFEYRQLKSLEKVFAEAEVLLQYTKEKNGRKYEVLKLQSEDGLAFFTTSREPIKDLTGRRVRLLLFPKRVSFYDYLKTPYIPSAIVRVEHERSYRMALFEKIKGQHSHPFMEQLYGALFLALPISKELRERVALLGVSHLLALSGFHLGLLWFLIYGALSLIYVPFQRRFFPWRHKLLDLGVITLLLLGVYLLFTGSPPSLLRAYAMLLVGWIALLVGLELLSFTFLAFCVVLLIALFPELLFSIGFWFSVSGVFFIYQFMQLSEGWPKWSRFLLINLWLYLAMLPVVHSIFGIFSLYQLLSIPLTILFSVFYPVSMLLHLLGYGSFADEALLVLLDLPQISQSVEVFTTSWLLALFIVFSVAAVKSRIALYLQAAFIISFFLFLVEKVAKFLTV